jgi:signal transduction histidine kinase
LVILLRAQLRFKMASTLHLEAVAEDFESLKREHARLLDSEARYKTLAGELETRVKSQVAQLEERQQMLYAAEKLAAIGQLAAGMAHEINNPLGFVRSNLSTFSAYLQKFAKLRSRFADVDVAWRELDLDFVLEDSLDLLGDSAVGIDRIARIVSDLKSFSNVDRATEEFANLNDSLKHAISMIERQLPPAVTLKLDLGDLDSFVCLPGHLNQLFYNLIRNAIQAVQDSGRPGEVRISSHRADHGIDVQIADNGVGMSPEQRARAFEPFFTTRPVGDGAGWACRLRAISSWPTVATWNSTVKPVAALPYIYSSRPRHDRLFIVIHRQDQHAAGHGQPSDATEIPAVAGRRRNWHRQGARPGISSGELRGRHRTQWGRSPAAPCRR